jgi:hypothetical protein
VNPDEGRLKTGEQETPTSAPRDQPAPSKTARTEEEGVEEEEEEPLARRLDFDGEDTGADEEAPPQTVEELQKVRSLLVSGSPPCSHTRQMLSEVSVAAAAQAAPGDFAATCLLVEEAVPEEPVPVEEEASTAAGPRKPSALPKVVGSHQRPEDVERILASLCAPLEDGETAFSRLSSITYELDGNRDPTTGEGTAMLYGSMHLDAVSFQAWAAAQPWLNPSFDAGEHSPPPLREFLAGSACLLPPLTPSHFTPQRRTNAGSFPRT